MEKFGKKPFDWQIEAACAILDGRRCLVKAGTGAGKTLPMVLPTPAYEMGFVLIPSPLVALQNDQVSLTLDP